MREKYLFIKNILNMFENKKITTIFVINFNFTIDSIVITDY